MFPIKAHSVQLFQSNSTVITEEIQVSDNWHSLTPQSTGMSWESWMRQDKIPAGSHRNLSLTLCSQSREEFIGASAETYHSLTHHWGFVEFLHYLLYLSFVFPFNWKVLLFYLSSVSSVWVLYNSIQLFLVCAHTHTCLSSSLSPEGSSFLSHYLDPSQVDFTRLNKFLLVLQLIPLTFNYMAVLQQK